MTMRVSLQMNELACEHWQELWEGYTHFYGSPQPEEVTECTWQRMLDVNSPVLGFVMRPYFPDIDDHASFLTDE
jgi:hypothetical protein